MTRLRVCACAAAAFVVAAAPTGCGFGPGASRNGVVTLTVTRDFGEHLLASAKVDKVTASDTVMRLLESQSHVATAYGGGYVQSVDGISGSRGARRDWFYYVNGTQPNVGASDYALKPGDAVQWDYHSWKATIRVPQVVGAYPAPFTTAHAPSVVECGAGSESACATAKQRLARAGGAVRGAPLGSPVHAPSVLVLVGPWRGLRALPAARSLDAGPAVSGVFARFEGLRLVLLDGEGGAALRAPAGTGLVAATETPDGTVTWLLTGSGTAGVARAAGALERSLLRDAFAVAVTPDASRDIPITAGR